MFLIKKPSCISRVLLEADCPPFDYDPLYYPELFFGEPNRLSRWLLGALCEHLINCPSLLHQDVFLDALEIDSGMLGFHLKGAPPFIVLFSFLADESYSHCCALRHLSSHINFAYNPFCDSSRLESMTLKATHLNDVVKAPPIFDYLQELVRPANYSSKLPRESLVIVEACMCA